MTQFVCRMALPTGEVVERTMDAESETALRRELEDKDMLVLELRGARTRCCRPLTDAFKSGRASRRESSCSSTRNSPRCSAPAFRSCTSLDILLERRKNQRLQAGAHRHPRPGQGRRGAVGRVRRAGRAVPASCTPRAWPRASARASCPPCSSASSPTRAACWRSAARSSRR